MQGCNSTACVSVLAGRAQGVVNAIVVQPVFAGERAVCYRERAAGMYAVLPFSLSLARGPPSLTARQRPDGRACPAWHLWLALTHLRRLYPTQQRSHDSKQAPGCMWAAPPLRRQGDGDCAPVSRQVRPLVGEARAARRGMLACGPIVKKTLWGCRQAAVELVYNAAQALLYTLIVYYMVGFDIDGSTGVAPSQVMCAVPERWPGWRGHPPAAAWP